MDGNDSKSLVDRCMRLETGQDELKEQLGGLTSVSESGGVLGSGCDDSFGSFPGVWKDGRPYKRVLEMMGSAVFVSSAPSLRIVYWNPAAETLYGWKEYEVIGQSDELLVAEEYYPCLQYVMEKLWTGQSWSGQFPCKKRSGEILMAMMTKCPLYEDGELSGIVTVSNDSALLNLMRPKIGIQEANRPNNLPRPRGPKLKQIQWNSRPLLPPVQIPSSVSNLASKVLPQRFGERTYEYDTCTAGSNNDAFENVGKSSRLAMKFQEKLNIRGDRNQVKDDESLGGSNSSLGESHKRIASSLSNHVEASPLELSNGCNDCVHVPLAKQAGKEATEAEESNIVEYIKNGMREHKNDKPIQNTGGSAGGQDSSSSKGCNELNSVVDCEIHWEDLQLGEEIGQGSFAKVYRGIWKGSDVAIKVFVGNEYSESTLVDYKKEIDIMKRLRHPHVLLFMGAAYSQERLAIVTEFLPRGSLFKTIHKDNQALDMRRRLRMALDVARGMNYLHHRNPPIVHLDLKSSNLLVDRNWTVKVGDFGLSRLKNATLLMTKSGKGTPQWMAPEVLRNEPSNEKCDVYSFGVILWELMTLSIPWNHLNSLQVVGIVGFMDGRLDIPEDVDPRISTIIHDCWHSDPDRRPSFAQILNNMTGLLRRNASAMSTADG